MSKDVKALTKVSRRDFLAGAAGAGIIGAGAAYAAAGDSVETIEPAQTATSAGSNVAAPNVAAPNVAAPNVAGPNVAVPNVAGPSVAEPEIRAVGRSIPTVRATEGGGFPVRRPFPVQGLSHVDPFMLLDEMGPVDWPPGKALGAPWHPHRGFETVTYLLEGAMEHEDSRGNVARLNPGGVQWMTAGAGIVHSELPEKKYKAKGGVMHGFQLWVNLPAAQKMIQPRYQDIPAGKLPTWTRPDGGVTVRVIAGEAQGMKAAAQTHTSITYLHVTVQPGAEHILPLPKHEDISIFLFKNGARFERFGEVYPEGRYLTFGVGEAVWIQAEEKPVDMLVLGAVPIGEPVARWGPFVMNYDWEIKQAIEDYRAGRLG